MVKTMMTNRLFFSLKLASGGSYLRQLYSYPNLITLFTKPLDSSAEDTEVCCDNEDSKRLLDVYRLVVMQQNPNLNVFI
jgi:hypothetical protein